MNQSVKAALLSGLVFPGIGQFSLGHKKRGWLFISFNVVFLYLIISEIMKQASRIVSEMQSSGMIMDVEAILKKQQSYQVFLIIPI